MALPGAQGSLRILRRHLQLSLHGAIPPPRCQIVVQGAAATKSEGETNLGMVRSAPGGLPPAKADCPPTLVRWTSMTAGYPSEEPIAGKPHDGICGGESQQWLSYPTFVQNRPLIRLADFGGPFTYDRLRTATPRTANPGDFRFKTLFQNRGQRQPAYETSPPRAI